MRTHLDKLVSLEYVLVHRGGRGQSFVYELLYDGQGQDGRPFLAGLIDVERLREMDYDGKNEPRPGGFEGGSSPHRALTEDPSSESLDAVSSAWAAVNLNGATFEGMSALRETAIEVPSCRTQALQTVR